MKARERVEERRILRNRSGCPPTRVCSGFPLRSSRPRAKKCITLVELLFMVCLCFLHSPSKSCCVSLFDISPWSSLTDLKLDFNERDILNAAKVPEMMAKVCLCPLPCFLSGVFMNRWGEEESLVNHSD